MQEVDIFIDPKRTVPRGRMKDVTYTQVVCNVFPKKKEQSRTRYMVGGNSINYPGNVGPPTADMLLVKILFNSTISTETARFMTAGINHFLLKYL